LEKGTRHRTARPMRQEEPDWRFGRSRVQKISHVHTPLLSHKRTHRGLISASNWLRSRNTSTISEVFMRTVAALLSLALVVTAAPSVGAEETATPAKELFGKATTPAALAPEAIGFYARGCLA